MQTIKKDRGESLLEAMLLAAAGIVTYAWGPAIIWNWFLEPMTGHELGPGQSLALCALCRVFMGGRSHDIGQGLKRAQIADWAALLHVWTMVAGAGILELLGVAF